MYNNKDVDCYYAHIVAFFSPDIEYGYECSNRS